MISGFVLAAALSAHSAAPAVTVEARSERVEVGYVELAEGRNTDAVARIQASLAANPQDPAALINLGAAYARLGQAAQARTALNAAATNADRFDLQLADGRWLDSRTAARIALTMLQNGQALALR